MSTRPLTLSVLDQAPISEGSTGAVALRNSLDLASLAEDLGYERYWVAEHHASPMVACASPEILIAEIAARTTHLRVGSGGVMLPHYSPLKVAETFSILSALHPGRVDLGLGRAPGTDPRTALALQRDRRTRAPDDFSEQLQELLGYLGGFPESHPFEQLATLPGGPERPEVWLLGSSPQSAIWAAQLGLPYSFGDFFTPEGPAIVQLYRERFQPTPSLPSPRVMVGVMVVCAETDEEAVRLASSRLMAFSLLRSGRQIALPPPERAIEFLAGDPTPTDELPGRRGVLGSPETVREELEELAMTYGTDELMLLTLTYDHDARRRSYELVAEAFGLQSRGAPPSLDTASSRL
jgi:luciferase family oxidoreductase group 1